MSTTTKVVCSDGEVDVSWDDLWRASQKVRDQHARDAGKTSFQLPTCPAEAVRCFFRGLWGSLSTADELQAYVAAKELEAEAMQNLLSRSLRLAPDLLTTLLSTNIPPPTAAKLLQEPLISSLLESHKQDRQQLKSGMDWACRAGQEFTSGTRCNLTLSDNMTEEYPRLADLVLDGDPNAFGLIYPWQLSGGRRAPSPGVFLWWLRALTVAGKLPANTVPYLGETHEDTVHEMTFNQPTNHLVAMGSYALGIDTLGVVSYVEGGHSCMDATTVLLLKLEGQRSGWAASSHASVR